MSIPREALNELLRSPYYVVVLDSKDNHTTVVRVKDYSDEEFNTFVSARSEIEKNILEYNDLYAMVAKVYENFMLAYENRVEAVKNNTNAAARDDLIELNSYFISFIAHLGMYLAVVPKKISSTKSNILEVHKTATNIEYDNNFSYRLLASLRNYALHNSPPITGIRGSNRMSTDNEPNFEYEIYIEKEIIIQDKEVARKLRVDFESDIERFPVVESITEVVESLKRIHWKTIKSLINEIDEPIRIIKSIKELTKRYDKQPYIASYFDDTDTGIGAKLELVPTHILDIKKNSERY